MAVVHPRQHRGDSGHLARSGLRWVTLGVELFAGLNAVGGGIGLMTYGLGIPEAQLEGTPFDSFLIPGLLLAFFVGGSMLLAASTVWRRDPRAGLASVAAGAVMLGWILVEALMIDDGRGLQVVVTLLSLLVIVLGWLLLRTEQARR